MAGQDGRCGAKARRGQGGSASGWWSGSRGGGRRECALRGRTRWPARCLVGSQPVGKPQRGWWPTQNPSRNKAGGCARLQGAFGADRRRKTGGSVVGCRLGEAARDAFERTRGTHFGNSALPHAALMGKARINRR